MFTELLEAEKHRPCAGYGTVLSVLLFVWPTPLRPVNMRQHTFHIELPVGRTERVPGPSLGIADDPLFFTVH